VPCPCGGRRRPDRVRGNRALRGPRARARAPAQHPGCLDRPTRGHYWLGGRDVSGSIGRRRPGSACTTSGFIFRPSPDRALHPARETSPCPCTTRASPRHGARAARGCSIASASATRLDHRPISSRVASASRRGGPALRVQTAPDPVGRAPGALDTRNGPGNSRSAVELHASNKLTLVIVHPRLGGGQGGSPADRAATARDRGRTMDVATRSELFGWRSRRCARNPGRSVLTLLACHGVAAFIAMVSFGEGRAARSWINSGPRTHLIRVRGTTPRRQDRRPPERRGHRRHRARLELDRREVSRGAHGIRATHARTPSGDAGKRHGAGLHRAAQLGREPRGLFNERT